MATTGKAKTAQELKKKYQKKRMTASTAAKYYLYDYIYWAYLKDEKKPIDFSKDRVLQDETPVFDILINDAEALKLYEIYNDLCEWINSAFENAVLMRNSLLDYIRMFRYIVTVSTAGENLRHTLGDLDHDDKMVFLAELTPIDILSTDPPMYKEKTILRDLRDKIERNLCYLNAYNSLIEIIAKQIKVPELTIFQVDMSAVNGKILLLNDALTPLREIINKRVIPDREIPLEGWEERLKALDEVPCTAPPVPTENLLQAENNVKTILSTQSNFTWSGAFSVIRKGYWLKESYWTAKTKKSAGGAENDR